jgi:tripartite-type tricarboxylate transporter receptor subunit TctC
MTLSKWLAASFLMVAMGSRAEWPEQPIKIIVPFAPGASTDIVIRQVAPKVSEILKTPVVIENRGGAGGLIGSEAVISAPADGYTLLAATTSYTALPALNAKMPFDTQKDFAPIALVADMPGIIVVPAKSPANTFKEFMAYAKTKNLNYGSAGAGTFPHLGMELLLDRAKLPMVHVPYKGAAPALTDTVAGHLDVKLDAYVSAGPYITDKRLKALAVTSRTRIPELPDVPTVAESGFPGYEVTYWIGIVSRSGVPAAVRAKLERAFVQAMTPENRAALQKLGVRPLGEGAKEEEALINRELVQWKQLIKAANIKAD